MDGSVKQYMIDSINQAVEVTKKIRNKGPNLYSDIFGENDSIEGKNLISFYTKKFEDYHNEFGIVLEWPDIPSIIKPFVDKKIKSFYKLMLNKKYVDDTKKIFKNPFSQTEESFKSKEDVINSLKATIQPYVEQQVKQFLNSELSDENNKLNLERIDTLEQSLTTPILNPEETNPNSEELEKQKKDKIPDNPTSEKGKPEISGHHVYENPQADDSGFHDTMNSSTEPSSKRSVDNIEEDSNGNQTDKGSTPEESNKNSQPPKRVRTEKVMDKASYYLTEGNANLPNTILAYYYLKMRDYVRVMRRMANFARVSRGDADEIAMIEFKTTEDNKLVEKIHHTYSSNKQTSKERYADIKKLLRADDIRVMEGVQKLKPEEEADFSETDLYRNSNDKRWIYKNHEQ